MVVFPLIAFLVSVACAAVIGYDTWRRPRPDRVVWTIAFAIFAIAAGSEVLGSLGEWTAPLARLYYLCGAVLVVGYLALGEGYLLARKQIERFAPGWTLLVTALAASLVIGAPIDQARLADDGWDAIERGPALVAMAVSINALGTIVLVAGALYSALRFRKLGIQRHRMIGCVLIAVGTLTVASGGTLTRFGRHEYLYIAMSIGVAIIFAGVLQTRRPETAGRADKLERAAAIAVSTNGAHSAASNGTSPHQQESPAISFIENQLLPLSTEALAAECAVWSAPLQSIEVFDRDQARMVWRLRSSLSEVGQARFDQLPPAVRLQLAELHQDVFTSPTATFS